MAVSSSAIVNTILGPRSSFRGDLSVDGFVRVDGEFRGSIRSSGKIIISDSSRCDASIVARSAIIGGIVRGDVCVTSKLTLLDGTIIVGDVFAAKLETEGEVIIHGYVKIPGQCDNIEDLMLKFMQERDTVIRPFGFNNAEEAPKAETSKEIEDTWHE